MRKTFTSSTHPHLHITVAPTTDSVANVKTIYSLGSTLGRNDDDRAELQRMFQWVRNTFLGESMDVFATHSGRVPPVQKLTPFELEHSAANPLGLTQDDRRQFVINHTINVNPSVDPVQLGELITSNALFPGVKLKLRAAAKSEFKQFIHDLLWSMAREQVVGKYWLDTNIPSVEGRRIFKVLALHGCVGHAHVDVENVLTGVQSELVYHDAERWAARFREVDEATAKAPLSPQSSLRRFIDKPEEVLTPNSALRRFIENQDVVVKTKPEVAAGFKPEMFDAREEHPAAPVVAATKKILDSVPFTGTEAPPAVGEKYHRADDAHAGRVFTVFDVAPGDYGTHTVTLDAPADPATTTGAIRVKVAYRDHAQWLARWRPVDSDGKAKPVEFVEIASDDDSEDCEVAFTEADKEAMQEVRDGLLEDNAERWIRVIGYELDRRVPGWRDYDPPGVLYDDCALIIRAIRQLNRKVVDLKQVKSVLTRDIERRADAYTRLEKRLLQASALRDQHARAVTQLTSNVKQLTVAAAKMHKNTHGIEAVKQVLAELSHTNILNLNPRESIDFVERMEKHGRRA